MIFNWFIMFLIVYIVIERDFNFIKILWTTDLLVTNK